MRRFAHSLPGIFDESRWEPLETHLHAVAARTRSFAAVFGGETWGEAAGLLHDIGKTAEAYQAYIRGAGGSPDHSTAGVVEAERRFGQLGRVLAFVIAGHHAGLADGMVLTERLQKTLENYAGWEAYTDELPNRVLPVLKKTRSRILPFRFLSGCWKQRLILRLQFGFSRPSRGGVDLFSCLVDADFLETEAFYSKAAGNLVARGGFSNIVTLRGRLNAFMAALHPGSPLTRGRGSNRDTRACARNVNVAQRSPEPAETRGAQGPYGAKAIAR